MKIPLLKYNSNNVSKFGMLHNVRKSLKCVVVISRSDNERTIQKVYVILACEKSGVYEAIGLKPTCSRKCHCSFRLRGRLVKALGR